MLNSDMSWKLFQERVKKPFLVLQKNFWCLRDLLEYDRSTSVLWTESFADLRDTTSMKGTTRACSEHQFV